jgi:radical SAM-linked protein
MVKMTDPNQPQKYRLRLLFAKKKEIKYISHLDLALAWERALRRAQIPLAYSQGFNPRPKMQFASGLPLGTIGSQELLDIIVTEPVDLEAALPRIQAALAVGIKLHAIRETPVNGPALQPLLRQAEYVVRVETDLPAAELSARIEDLLAAEEVIQIRRRRKKEEKFDLRSSLHRLELVSADNNEARLTMSLTAGQKGNLRPEAVLKALGLENNWAEIERTWLIFADEVGQ